MRNIVNLKSNHQHFKDPDLKFIVSSRQITAKMDIIDYLKIFYMYIDTKQIDSVFGNTIFPSQLYGGRSYKIERSISDKHIEILLRHNIGLSLTMTNHFFSEKAYKESLELLTRHHRKENSVICTNDDLAFRIKNDFPLYSIKASIVKNINTQEKIKHYLKLYDYITIPMDKNDDDEFLQSINEKGRMILFANANCAYTCPQRSCYLGFSQKMAGKPVTSSCSKNQVPRPNLGTVYFNVKKFQTMGYKKFKLVSLAPAAAPGVTTCISLKRR